MLPYIVVVFYWTRMACSELEESVYRKRPRILTIVFSKTGEEENDDDFVVLRALLTSYIPKTVQIKDEQIKKEILKKSYKLPQSEVLWRHVARAEDCLKELLEGELLKDDRANKTYGPSWYDFVFLFFFTGVDENLSLLSELKDRFCQKEFINPEKLCVFVANVGNGTMTHSLDKTYVVVANQADVSEHITAKVKETTISQETEGTSGENKREETIPCQETAGTSQETIPSQETAGTNQETTQLTTREVFPSSWLTGFIKAMERDERVDLGKLSESLQNNPTSVFTILKKDE